MYFNFQSTQLQEKMDWWCEHDSGRSWKNRRNRDTGKPMSFIPLLANRSVTHYYRLLASSCCPSVCPSVKLCILTLRVGVQAKSCTSMFLAGMFLFVPSDTFAVGCIV